MAGLSDYYENVVLDAIFGAGFTKDATVYVALLTTAPTDASDGSTIVEPTAAQYANYARVAVTNNTTNWPAASSATKSNGTVITFPTSTGGASSPVTVTHWAILNGNTTTNSSKIITWGTIAGGSGASVSGGVAPQFAVGALQITAD